MEIEEMFISVVMHNYRHDFIDGQERDRLLGQIGTGQEECQKVPKRKPFMKKKKKSTISTVYLESLSFVINQRNITCLQKNGFIATLSFISEQAIIFSPHHP